MQEQPKVKLFREKSLEAIESPEKLNDYLHVTSAGVWLVMGAVVALLIGFVLWGIFGRIDTSVNIAVYSQEGRAVCYVPYEELEAVAEKGEITISGKTYSIRRDASPEIVVVSEDMNPFLRVAGNLNIGDVTVELELDAHLEDGAYSATVVTESIKPASLLFG